MAKKAIIFDFDNTIYPVHSIGEKLFEPLFNLLEESGELGDSLQEIKQEIMRKPFQNVAEQFGLSKELTDKGIDLLKGLTYEGEIKTFDDYSEVLKIPTDRFLVTTGFYKLQNSKIKGIGIENDFTEIHIVDPETTRKTKRDVFKDIMTRFDYTPSEVLVVGDDLEFEIKAGEHLGIETVLYDKSGNSKETNATHTISDFNKLHDLWY